MRKKLVLLIILVVFAMTFISATNSVILHASSYPYLDTNSVSKFDDFNMETQVDENKSSQANVTLSQRTNVKYRISLSNDDLVTVTGENLVFSGITDGYIHFEEQIKSTISGKYLVIKTNCSEIEKIDIALDTQNYVSTSAMYVTDDIMLIGESIATYSEPETGYYYMVIDIVKSGLKAEASTDIISIKYSGSTSMSIDEIFMCNDTGTKNYITEKINRTFTVSEATSEYAFASFDKQYINTKFNYLTMTITKYEETLDLSGFVMAVNGKNYYAVTDNAPQKIILTNGDFDFTDAYSKTLTLDLKQMGITSGGIFELFIDSSISGKFAIENITFSCVPEKDIIYTEKQSLNGISVINYTSEQEENILLDTEVNFSPSYNALALDITGNIDYSKLVFEFGDVTDLYLVTGEKLSEVISNNGKTLFIDLTRSGIIGYSGTLKIKYNSSVSALSITNATLGQSETVYSYIESNFEEYEKVDTTPPVVKIYNEPDVVITTDTYSLKIIFDSDYNIDNDVQNVKIILTDSDEKSVYGDESHNTFTVKEGVYLVTIISTDTSGNQGTESMTITIIKDKEVPDDPNGQTGGDNGETGDTTGDNGNNDANSDETGNENNNNESGNNTGNGENNTTGNTGNDNTGESGNATGNNNQNPSRPPKKPDKKSFGVIKIVLIVIGSAVLLAGLVVLAIFLIKRFGLFSSNRISF